MTCRARGTEACYTKGSTLELQVATDFAQSYNLTRSRTSMNASQLIHEALFGHYDIPILVTKFPDVVLSLGISHTDGCNGLEGAIQ